MIRFREALAAVLDSIGTIGTERISLLSGLHRILRQDITSTCDVPAFANSAMDGYALRYGDVKNASWKSPVILEVVGDIPAGYVSKKRLKKGQAMRIMTGAAVPQGADSVVMVEFTQKFKETSGQFVKVFRAAGYKENIRARAEDVRRGEKVLTKGSLIRPQEMGMLASLGVNSIRVAKKPRVGILTTGNELVEIDEPLTSGKIRDSNAYCLTAQVLSAGASPLRLGISRDNPGEVKRKILAAIDKNVDLLLVSGGVSVGDYDLVKDVLLELGTRIKVWKVAIRPGKPLVFGHIKGIPVFGLPGNPVSGMVVFEEFVRPAILKMCGATKLFRSMATAILKNHFEKRKGLKYFVRVKIENKDNIFYASLTGPQGSGMLKSMVLADAIMVVPEGLSELKKGDRVCVEFITDNL